MNSAESWLRQHWASRQSRTKHFPFRKVNGKERKGTSEKEKSEKKQSFYLAEYFLCLFSCFWIFIFHFFLSRPPPTLRRDEDVLDICLRLKTRVRIIISLHSSTCGACSEIRIKNSCWRRDNSRLANDKCATLPSRRHGASGRRRGGVRRCDQQSQSISGIWNICRTCKVDPLI